MAQKRTVSAREHGSHPPPPATDPPYPEDVDTKMEAVQQPPPNPCIHRVRPEPERQQLPARNHSVLESRKRLYLLILLASGQSSAYMTAD